MTSLHPTHKHSRQLLLQLQEPMHPSHLTVPLSRPSGGVRQRNTTTPALRTMIKRGVDEDMETGAAGKDSIMENAG